MGSYTPTNQQVFNKSIALLLEYLHSKDLDNVADLLEETTRSYQVPDASEDYFPNVLDVSLLERLLATTVLSQCTNDSILNQAKNNEKDPPSSRNRTPAFTPVKIREVPDTWTDSDCLGYDLIPTSEEDLNAYAATEYETTTLGHEGYESYPQFEWDTELLERVQEKIESLKKQFPGELKSLVTALGITESDESDEEQLNSLLLDHFKDQIESEEASALGFSPKPKPSTSNPEVYESFFLKIIQTSNKTGFEETKDFPIIIGDIIAGRYQVQEYLGSAAFSRAIQCYDLVTNRLVCMKIITNNKDFFDQSLDEIKLLTLIKSHGDLDAHNLLEVYDYFYFKEHLFLVTELLRDNLYEFYKYNFESGEELYFNMERLKKVAHQILVALEYMHKLNLIHCDLKPENILIKSYSRCQVKVIDLGSSCFITDHLSSYVQSRSYRAPEVILGLPYGRKIDIWSLGCILAELYTGNVLFLNDTLATLLARVDAIIGPIPTHMQKGIYYYRYFTLDGNLYDRRPGGPVLIKTKSTSLAHRLGTDDPLFLDFMTRLLSIDPANRPTSSEALRHPWLAGIGDKSTE